MGYYDPRPPAKVAANIVASLQSHWASAAASSPSAAKPKLLMTQGDPASERGISAITPLVAELLGIQRGLVVLDEDIDPHHTVHAPRDDVVVEFKYSDMLRVLENSSGSGDKSCAPSRLEGVVDAYLARKNAQRLQRDNSKPPLPSYFKDYAMLQEVTKAACRVVCEDVTVAHTAREISDFSVTSFYEVGIELGLLDFDKHYVPYGVVDEELDFDKIDKR